MKRSLIFIVTLAGLAALTLGLGYFQFVFKPQMIRKFISQAAPPPATVAVAVATKETWTAQLPAIGSLRAVQGIDVAPQIGGMIVSIRVRSGQDVEKSAPLFEIDNTVEQADLKNNLATLKNAELALERQKQLSQTGNSAKSNFDAAEAARDTAAASVERVRAIIAQKNVVAPYAGRLGIRKVDLGQYVSPGTSVITLQQLDPIYVDFPVPEKSLAVLKPGEAIELQVDAYPGKIFHGTIKTIDARVGQDSRNVLVQGELENKDRQLFPGMFANVSVIAGGAAEVVTLPRTAITYSLYGDSVFIIRPAPPDAGGAQAATLKKDAGAGGAAPEDRPLIVERRFVRIGETREGRVSILEGVNAGDEVVSEGQLKLQPGARVRIDPDARLEAPAVRPKE
jgi:membrane fusion protein (multidrug efflux system)